MTAHLFLLLLLLVSVFTSLFTEGIKIFLQDKQRPYRANTIAGICAIILSLLVFAGYIILTESLLNAQMAVYLIALVLLSWLSAMVGYDKVVQAISQFHKGV